MRRTVKSTKRAKRPAGRVKAEAIPAPQTKDQAAAAIAEIGRRQRQCARIQAAMNDKLARTKERFERAAAIHTERVKGLILGVQAWCEAHRAELTEDGKTKTAAFASGEVSWRLRPPSVTVRGADDVIENLKKLGLERFVRTKEEINKEAILAETAAVEGIKNIKIDQGEDFIVKPFETALEEMA